MILVLSQSDFLNRRNAKICNTYANNDLTKAVTSFPLTINTNKPRRPTPLQFDHGLFVFQNCQNSSRCRKKALPTKNPATHQRAVSSTPTTRSIDYPGSNSPSASSSKQLKRPMFACHHQPNLQSTKLLQPSPSMPPTQTSRAPSVHWAQSAQPLRTPTRL